MATFGLEVLGSAVLPAGQPLADARGSEVGGARKRGAAAVGIGTALIAFAAVAQVAQAAYVPFVNDPLTSINASNWYQNGSLTAGASGITSATAGSLIWKTAAPTYANDYLATATINLPANTNGGSYGVMVRATSNALASSPTPAGSFYMLEVQNPVWSGGTCSAGLVLLKSVSGTVTSLYSGTTWCSTQFTISLVVSGSGMVMFQGRNFIGSPGDSSLATGQPGVSVRNAPAGSSVSLALFYPGDHTAPNSIDLSNLSTSSYPNRIDMQWKAPADDANGSGLALTIVYRGSSNIAGYSTYIGEFTDNTVSPATTYTYNIISCDMFYNCSNSVFNATTAPSGSTDPRQIGMRPTATTWGGGGENINLLSGNLNFTLPLLTAKGRGGMSLGIGLNYNSQNWRQDSAGTWNYGRDIGYGYGFRVGAGSMQQYVNAQWGIDHWTFTDSTGTEYRLDQQVNQAGSPASGTGLWATSTDSAAFVYDSNTNRLYFPSGTFWQFDCISLGNEGDSTARYVTLVQDSNGNQLAIRYKPGVAAVDSGGNVYQSFSNSSGRIDQIEDIRAVAVTPGPSGWIYATYQFNYNNDNGVPHLTSITNNISTAEGYTFGYSTGTLTSPWGAAFGSTTKLTSVTVSGVALNYGFTYDPLDSYGSAVTQVTFPYGGYIKWQYADATYSGSRVQKEVVNRYIPLNGATAAYSLTAVQDAAHTMHQSLTLNDADGKGQKVWTFNTAGTYAGLVSQYQGNERSGAAATVLQQVDTTWYAPPSPSFGPYISSIKTTMDPATAAVVKKVDQEIDLWGNLKVMKIYDFGSLVTPRRTYTNTYLATSPYTTRSIRNRLLTSTVLESGVTTTLVSNTYDVYQPGAIVSAAAVRQFDAAYSTSFQTRGNVTTSQGIGSTTYMTQFDNTGNVLQMMDQTGVIVTNSTTGSTNYAAPSSISVNSLSSNFQYASNLLPTQNQGPNGDISTTTFDTYARPTSSTSKTGAVTYFSYVNSPPQVLVYSSGRVSRTTLDGFGRTIKTESGTGTYSSGTGAVALVTTVSTVESKYVACGCSPLGKLGATSRPYAPGGTVYWTTYNFDGIGRTKNIVAPDNVSTSYYQYSGSQVYVADQAAKYKVFVTDAVGNLTQVTEPNPGGFNDVTTYSYDVLNRLRTVTMPRWNGSSYNTQTRTFTYTGALLTSVTNPENGTVTNYYNPDNTLNYKVDAKGQAVVYSYDNYKRVIQISKFPYGYTPGGTNNEDLCQQVQYKYDSNPDTTNYNYTQYLSGRLASVHYAGAGCSQFNGTASTSYTGNNYIDMYAYSQAGQVLRKTMRLVKKVTPGNPVTVFADLESVYTYDSEGKMLSQSYPLGATYSYIYDAMGRPTKMTDTSTSTDLVASVTYGPAGELLTMTGSSVSETRTYNSMGQLTRLTGIGMDLKYNYPAAGANNGQIASQQDLLTGETITYQYDSLKRLASATSTQGWGQGFGYDGFGNLASKTALSGTPPVGSYPADPATNRLSGGLYDSNGNQVYGGNGSGLYYDVANRMTSSVASSLQGFYEYDASNKRVYQQRQHYTGSAWVTDATEYYFYGVTGQKIGTYWATVSGFGGSASVSWAPISTQVFFAARLVQRGGASVQSDRLGSIGAYFPYGEERGTSANDVVKFATYIRDGVSGLDYADQRWYASGGARFLTADPYQASAGVEDPASWNRYAYVRGEPIARRDPSGLYDCEMSCGYQVYGEGSPSTGDMVDPNAEQQKDTKGGWESVFPKCNSGNGNGAHVAERDLAFIARNYAGALSVANQVAGQMTPGTVNSGALAVMFLQWGLWESGQRLDPIQHADFIAQKDAQNNFFGTQGMIANSIVCPAAALPTANSCFPSTFGFGPQLQQALSMTSPNATNNPGGFTYGTLLQIAIAQNPGSPAAWLQGIGTAWNPRDRQYGQTIVGGIPGLGALVDCMKKNNYL